MTIPTITALPTAPARTDSPATFVSRADAWVAALGGFTTETNAAITQLNIDVPATATNATNAAASAVSAASAQAAAESASNASAWVSAGSYTAGNVVWSLVNFLSYRARTTHSGLTTDPSLDGTNWAALVGSGSLVYLSTVSASGASTADIETTFNSTYDAYMIVASGITVSVDGARLDCRLKLGGSYLSANYYQICQELDSGSAAYFSTTGETNTLITIANAVGNAASESTNIVMHVFNPSSTAFKKLIQWQRTSISDDGFIRAGDGYGSNQSPAALTGVRIFPNSGTLSGEFRLYGISNS